MDIITYLSENAGVLISLGQDSESEVFHFAHRSFQEYLAAQHLLQLCRKESSFGPLTDLVLLSPQAWREPGRLVGDIVTDIAGIGEIWTFLEDLIGQSPHSNLPPDSPSWWPLWLAVQVADDQNLFASSEPGVRRASQKTVANAIRDGIHELVSTPAALPPIERALCGRALSALGDPRPGVGILFDGALKGLPDIVWCKVPAGPFIAGSDNVNEFVRPRHTVEMANSFLISKYPVTNAQFKSFVADPDGYANPEWWLGMHESARPKDPRAFGRIEDAIDNHPCTWVSWFEAMAFCAWLSSRVGRKVTLPTHYQWEKAARGPDGLSYPYGNVWDTDGGNTQESGIGRTAAVGLYPKGSSPYGAEDMSGNIEEWTLTEYATLSDNNIASSNDRVLKGGCWTYVHNLAVSAGRISHNPAFLGDFIGFRIVSAMPED